MDDVGFLEAVRDIADLAVDVDVDVSARVQAFVVKDRRARLHRLLGIEDGGQDLIVDLDQPCGCFGGGLGFGDDGGDALADETHDVVQHVGIVGIDEVILVRRRAVEPARNVLPGEDGDNSGNRHRLVAANGANAGMRMRRTQDLEMQRRSAGRHRACSAPGP